MSADKQFNSEMGGTRDVDVLASEDLRMMGYNPAMVRSRGLFHVLFMTLAIMAVPYGLAAPIATSLIGGGALTMIWGWVLVSVFTQALALSLAEICSKYPTSAGAYYWSFRLANPSSRVVLSWINGWMTIVGVWTISLSVNFGTAQLIVAGAGIYHPEWAATPWQTYLIFLVVTAVSSTVCIFFNRVLPLIDTICAYWTGLGIIIILICTSVTAASGRHTAAYALGHFDASASGWPAGWTFFIGLLPVPYTYAAIGMIASMAEEVHNPGTVLPRAISWSVPIGTLFGLFFLLPLVFTLPDVKTLLAVASGQPIGVMFELIMGSKAGGFGMWFIIFGIGMFCAISICCAASRATWAFSRDKAIPGHHIFSQVHASLGDVPLYAFLLSTTIQILLGLLYLGSSAAFNAFSGVGVICLGTSYALPVAISLMNGRRDVEDAPFSLGRWGTVINLVTVLWVLFSICLFSMPAVVPVTKTTMNYAPVVYVGFGVISAVWYFIGGRGHYTGPPVVTESNSKGEKN